MTRLTLAQGHEREERGLGVCGSLSVFNTSLYLDGTEDDMAHATYR